MRYFLDTEFNNVGPGYPITLISIGIVSEDGRELYREHARALVSPLNQWVLDHVMPHLAIGQPGWSDDNCVKGLQEIAADVRSFVGDDLAPEFWGYYCHFDFVLMQQLFGDFSQWPQGWPMYCHDLRQWLDNHGLQDVKQPDDAPHNALDDARWIARTFRRLSAGVGV